MSIGPLSVATTTGGSRSRIWTVRLSLARVPPPPRGGGHKGVDGALALLRHAPATVVLECYLEVVVAHVRALRAVPHEEPFGLVDGELLGVDGPCVVGLELRREG